MKLPTSASTNAVKHAIPKSLAELKNEAQDIETPNRFLKSCNTLLESNPFDSAFSGSISLPPISTIPRTDNNSSRQPSLSSAPPLSAPPPLVKDSSLSTIASPSESVATPTTPHGTKRPLTTESKKRQTLENNRKAASKCRKRKKEKIGTMEQEVAFYTTENQELSTYAEDLRNELSRLQRLLMRHMDCPVALKSGMDVDKISSVG